MPTVSRRKRALARAGLILSGILAGALIGEIAVRTLHLAGYVPPKLLAADGHELADLSDLVRVFGSPRPGEPPMLRMLPGAHAYGWYDHPKWKYFDSRGCVEYRVNSLGFRDHEFPLEKRPDELRVLALGDSFTLGIGVQLDDCWVQVLERGLARTRSGPVEVINAGFCSGYQPDMYAPWLSSDGLKLDPDLVIVGLCLNDVSNGIPLTVDHRDPPAVFDGRVQLLVLAQRVLARSRDGAGRPADFDVKGALGDPPYGWILCQEGLLAMQRTLTSRRIRMIVAIQPMLTRLRAGYPFHGIHELVRDFCAAHDLECVDLLDRFLGKDEHDLWVHPTDQHPNDVGHRLIGEGILEYLSRHPAVPLAPASRR